MRLPTTGGFSTPAAAPTVHFPTTGGSRLRHRFVGALTTLLRQAEGEAAWRSAIGFGSGVLFVALVLSDQVVAFRADDLDPGTRQVRLR